MVRVLVLAAHRAMLDAVGDVLYAAGLDRTGVTAERHARMALEAGHGDVLLLGGDLSAEVRGRVTRLAQAEGVPVIERFGAAGPEMDVREALELQAVVA